MTIYAIINEYNTIAELTQYDTDEKAQVWFHLNRPPGPGHRLVTLDLPAGVVFAHARRELTGAKVVPDEDGVARLASLIDAPAPRAKCTVCGAAVEQENLDMGVTDVCVSCTEEAEKACLEPDPGERFEEITEEINRLADEAMRLVREEIKRTGDRTAAARARGYWYGHIKAAVGAGDYAGHATTMRETATEVFAPECEDCASPLSEPEEREHGVCWSCAEKYNQ